VPERGDAADRLAGVLADELGRRAAYVGDACHGGQLRGVGPVGAAGEHQQGGPVGVEDERVGDGPDRAAELLCRQAAVRAEASSVRTVAGRAGSGECLRTRATAGEFSTGCPDAAR
jgi:hypothetical protein